MTIEYHPQSLKMVIESELAKKRLKNREGEAEAFDLDGRSTGWKIEGRLLDVNEEALEYLRQNPDLRVLVTGYSCGSIMIS